VILITDDNEFNLKVANGLLHFMDIEADLADSGAKAIECVKQKDYDIVFMDHMMPEMDGVETVHRIRDLGGKYKTLNIIALTANAISGAREMFMENGFNDFISKPINAAELQEIVKKYLPPHKVSTAVKDKDQQQAARSKEEELREKAILTFFKENQDTLERINGSLSSGDTKTAHRIAHTLKSSAGYLGKKALQEAAFSLETSLGLTPPNYTADQLRVLERELASALTEFAPLAEKAESEKRETVQISAEALAVLLAELRPLVEGGNYEASGFVERLQTIEGLGDLAERIEEYDFDAALQLIDELQKTGRA
jgi:CheY-like chemotaxis protein